MVDLLKLDNPGGIGQGDGWVTGDPFSFGVVTVETMVPLGHGRVMIANDNNYPGTRPAIPARPTTPR